MSYLWDATNTWKNDGSSEYTYDNSGNQTIEIISSLSLDTWKNSKFVLTYDSKSNITMIMYYNLDASTNSWKVGSKTEYTYNSNGKETLDMSYQWDVTTNTWKIHGKVETTYNIDGYKINIKEYSGTNFLYTNTEYTYDKNGNILTIDCSDYDWTSSSDIRYYFY